ncbi:MAG TPA: hypothetical protein VMV23_00540 [Candidatus Nanopelagicaceae bacterium]|nr:hypothetical protein [Candidatus Nanopelagicaceae bacterium]
MLPELPSGPAQRSRGESLLRRLSIWAGLGAMVATGAAGAAVANALPGRTATPTVANASGTSSSGGGSIPVNPASSGVGQGTAPAPSAATPVVTSGGS